MSRTITLKLTQKQADALRHAAGNSLASLDENDLLALFNDDRAAIRSAMRAFEKLNSAINKGGAR